jgi:hypothetical protein
MGATTEAGTADSCGPLKYAPGFTSVHFAKAVVFV